MISKDTVRQLVDSWLAAQGETVAQSETVAAGVGETGAPDETAEAAGNTRAVTPDLYLVDLKVTPSNLISVELETDRGSVDIDDCVALNNYLEAHLDREAEDYSLEVSSAGLGQPFKVLRQYRKHIGMDVEVSLRNGQRFDGVLKDATEEAFTVSVSRKVKPEGAKRPTTVTVDEMYRYEEANSVCYKLVF